MIRKENEAVLETSYHRTRTDLAALRLKCSSANFARLALKYDPNQPRVPAGNSGGGQWTSEGGATAGDLSVLPDGAKPVFAPAVIPPLIVGLESALAVFAGLLALNTGDRRPVFEFNAREFGAENSEPSFAASRLLTREEVNDYCPRLNEVQARTDFAASSLQREDYSSPAQYGTAVHAHLKHQIDALEDNNFRAEVSLLKTREALYYSQKDSIRVDVFERVNGDTVCVYGIKTGTAGLTAARFQEIAARAFEIYGKPARLVITEVRPIP